MSPTNTTSKFFYVIYIRSTPDKIWEALTNPDLTRQYWFGMSQESNWQPGDSWQMRAVDGSIRNTGEVLESNKPSRLVLRWRYEPESAAKQEGNSIMTMDIEAVGEEVKLTLRHEIGVPDSTLINLVGNGWPRILSNLKSLLETGSSSEASKLFPVGTSNSEFRKDAAAV